jgi:hypothetical protein
MAVFMLSITAMANVPQADYTPPEAKQSSAQSYEFATGFDFAKVEFVTADIVYVILETGNIAFINTAADNSDIGHINQFRLYGMFDKHNNAVFRYSKRYNIATYYYNSIPFIYQRI